MSLRYAEAAFRIGFHEVFRKAFRFLAEYEHIIVLELDIGVTLFRFGRQIEKTVVFVFVQDFLKIFMDLDIDERPVIEAGPFQMLVIDGKAQGLDQMQRNMIGCA